MADFSNDLSNEERETHANMAGDTHGEWTVFSDDPYWVRRLDKIAAGTPVGKGKEYKLQANQVTLRAVPKKRKITDEQRDEQRQKLAALREAGRLARTNRPELQPVR